MHDITTGSLVHWSHTTVTVWTASHDRRKCAACPCWNLLWAWALDMARDRLHCRI